MRQFVVLVLLVHLVTGQTERALVYLGRGYNVVRGNPMVFGTGDGDGSSAIDPGLTTARVLKMDEGGTTIILAGPAKLSGLKCEAKSKFVTSPVELQQAVLGEMFTGKNSWHASLLKNAIAGSINFGANRFPTDSIYLFEYDKCAYDSATTHATLVKPGSKHRRTPHEVRIDGVSQDFQRSVCSLPEEYQRGNQQYNRLISYFGTSVVTGLKMGMMTIKRYRTQLEVLSDLKTKLRFGEPVVRPDYPGANRTMYIHITENLLRKIDQSFIKNKHGRKSQWATGNRLIVSPVELTVNNLDEFVHTDYWPYCRRAKLPDSEETNCCHRLESLRESVKAALEDYPEAAEMKLTEDTELLVPVKWPEGSYSMFQTSYGCPAETGFQWEEGMVQHTPERNTNTSVLDVFPEETVRWNSWYETPEGKRMHYYFGYVVKQRFCTKVASAETAEEEPWPEGSYCIYKHGTCPGGFKSGWVYWDDRMTRNMNEKHGTVPDGVYNKNTQMFFCCRMDGSANNPIVLPVAKPFFLMRKGGKCQQVEWADVREEFIQFDGEWSIHKSSHFYGGFSPDNDIKYSDNKLYYCFYKYKNY